jgi:hypothetical protein
MQQRNNRIKAQRSVVQHSTGQCSAAQHSTSQHSTAQRFLTEPCEHKPPRGFCFCLCLNRLVCVTLAK